LGALAAVGVVHDTKHDETDVAVSGGIFYAFRF
jgi:hypothetical protein